MEKKRSTQSAAGAGKAPRSGTQSIERASLLLRELATRGRFGMSLAELAQRSGMEKATAHRILMCLVRERFVHKRAIDRRYLPGPLLFELSLAVPEFSEVRGLGEAILKRMYKPVTSVALFSLRSGMDFVCVARAFGKGTPPALSLDIGTRRPLLGSAAGTAILVDLPAAEARAVIAHNLKAVTRSGGVPVKSLKSMLRRSQSLGYGAHFGDIVPHWNSIGVSIRDASQAPWASIMIAAPEDELSLTQIPDVIASLRQEALVTEREIARLFRNLG